MLNSIGQTLMESMDLGDSLHRTLRQMAELFSLDACALYLFDEEGTKIRRVAAVGHRSEYARNLSSGHSEAGPCSSTLRRCTRRFFRSRVCRCPRYAAKRRVKEELLSAYIVVLWSKDRVIGGLTVGSRTPARIFAGGRQPADRGREPALKRHRTHDTLRGGPAGVHENLRRIARAALAQREDGGRRTN